MQNFEMSESMT